MSRKMRSLAVLAVLVVLAAGSASALPLEAARTEGQTDFLSLVWEWLASLIGPTGTQASPDLNPLWEEEGSQMDPNGNH